MDSLAAFAKQYGADFLLHDLCRIAMRYGMFHPSVHLVPSIEKRRLDKTISAIEKLDRLIAELPDPLACYADRRFDTKGFRNSLTEAKEYLSSIDPEPRKPEKLAADNMINELAALFEEVTNQPANCWIDALEGEPSGEFHDFIKLTLQHIGAPQQNANALASRFNRLKKGS